MRGWAAILVLCVFGSMSVCDCGSRAGDASTGGAAARSDGDSAVTAPSDSPRASVPGGFTVQPVESRAVDLSVIAIVSEMECELCLTDPVGRRTGRNPAWEKPLQEIPRSAYYEELIEDPDGEASMENRHLEIMGPATGEYRLEIFGASGDVCDLAIRLYDTSGDCKAIDLSEEPLVPGAPRCYTLAFDRNGAALCSLTIVEEDAGK